MSELTRLSAAEIAAAIAAGEASAEEVTQAHLDRIEQVDGMVRRVPACRRRRCVGRCPPGRRGSRGWSPAGSAGGSTARHEGRRGDRGSADNGRLEDPRRLDTPVRRDDHSQDQGRRDRDARQDQHGRVRHGLVHGEFCVPPDTQSLGPWSHPGRVVGRLERRGVRLRGAARHRNRYRRLDPAAGCRHRHCRAQADVRRGFAIRIDRVLLVTRPGRAVRPDRARCCFAARGDGRPRSARFDLDPTAGATGGRGGARRGPR